MARKPNYRFERFERDRAKAAKKAAKAEARALRKAAEKADGEGVNPESAGEAGADENGAADTEETES